MAGSETPPAVLGAPVYSDGGGVFQWYLPWEVFCVNLFRTTFNFARLQCYVFKGLLCDSDGTAVFDAVLALRTKSVRF